MSNDEVLLRVDHLCQYFSMGTRELKAVDDISFEIKKGEVFGLVGESGCGKTTTGRSIIKLYDITSGSIYFKGKRIAAGTRSYKLAIEAAAKEFREAKKRAKSFPSPETAEAVGLAAEKYKRAKIENKIEIKKAKHDQKYADRDYGRELARKMKEEYEEKLSHCTPEEKDSIRANYAKKIRYAKKQKFITRIQMIFQDPVASLDPRMTVKDIIAEGLVIRGDRDKKEIEEKVYKVLELVGLVPDHAGRYPHEFSGGQRQRIGVARAVIMNPELIIADEPVSALDVSIQAQVINLLDDLRHNYGITIMFIAHNLSVVKYFSDRIGVMYYGHLVELAESAELFKHPLHPYTQSLLSAIPQPDPYYERVRERIVYNQLSAHDYSVEQPVMREVAPGHYVRCNQAEFEKYQKLLTENA